MFKNSQSNAPRPDPSSPGMRATPVRKMTGRFQIIVASYFIPAFAYGMYSSMTESGLDAYLTRLQLDTIGEAGRTTTGLLTLAVLLAPLFAIWGIAEKFAPSLVWIPSEAGLPKPGTLDERMNRPRQLPFISWKLVFAVTAIPIVAAAVLFTVLNYSSQRDQREKVYPVDLTSGVAAPPKDAKFVELTGLLARSHALTYKSTYNSSVTYELFAPVTGNGWTPADSVRYFVHYRTYQASPGEVKWPEAFQKGGAAMFSGQISRSLPALVESEYRSKGLRFGPTYSVIEWKDIRDGKVPSSSGNAAITAGICLMCFPFVFIFMAMLKRTFANMNQKA